MILINYGKIHTYDISNGPGVRVSLFISGCRNHCKGCFNPETWDFDYGQPFTEDTMTYILKSLKPYWITGFSLLGGDSFEPENQKIVVEILRKIRSMYPTIDIWAYTGYLYDSDLQEEGKVYTDSTEEILSHINTLVDGPFVEELKDISLAFRGSSNQRIIDLDYIRNLERLGDADAYRRYFEFISKRGKDVINGIFGFGRYC